MGLIKLKIGKLLIVIDMDDIYFMTDPTLDGTVTDIYFKQGKEVMTISAPITEVIEAMENAIGNLE